METFEGVTRDQAKAVLLHGWERIAAASYNEFQIAGMELHDYSENCIVGKKCKVTFFAAESHPSNLLRSSLNPNGFTIASLEELQDLKARSSSRDWLDLFLLERGFGLPEWKSAFEKAGLRPDQFISALAPFDLANCPQAIPDSSPCWLSPLPSIRSDAPSAINR